MSSPAEFEGAERTEAVRIWLLGDFRVAVGSRTVEDGAWRLRGRLPASSSCFLAAGHRMHREQAMDLLWPELGKKGCPNNMRCDPSTPPGGHCLGSSGRLALCGKRG